MPKTKRFSNIAGCIGIAVLGLGLASALFIGQYSVDLSQRDSVQATLVEIPDILKTNLTKFDRLPQNEQQEILSKLEQYVLTQTTIGRTADNLAIKVPEMQIPEIGTFLASPERSYNSYNNTIPYAIVSNSRKVELYLLGNPYELGKAHERFHAVQDRNSRWDKFETFLYSITPDTHDVTSMKIMKLLTEDKAKDFATDFLKKPEANYDDIKQEIREWLRDTILHHMKED